MIKVVDGIKYELYELPKHHSPFPKQATVVGMADDCYVSILEVKAYVDGHRVTQIAKDAFNKNNILHSLILPATITTIGTCAFQQCSNLKRVELQSDKHNNPIQIGHLAFCYCNKLEEVISTRPMVFDDKSSGIFRNCPCLKTIPPLYNKIPWHICYESHGVTELTILNPCLISSVLFPNDFEWAVFDSSGIKKLIVTEFATTAPNAFWEDFNMIANVLNQSRVAIQTTEDSPAVNLAFDGVEIIIVEE